jgi:hypothetical protein
LDTLRIFAIRPVGSLSISSGTNGAALELEASNEMRANPKKRVGKERRFIK